MSAAVTSPSPLLISTIVSKLGSSLSTLKTTRFKFKIIVITSSTTPSTFWNSCSAPSIFTLTNAAPGKEDNNVLRKALPKVIPNPLSSGLMTNFP